MRQQALAFSKAPAGQASPGRRYIYGKVCMGELKEPFWSGTHVWTAREYQRQWSAAARLCLKTRCPVLLYTDVEPRTAMAYHVVPTATGLLIFEQGFRSPYRPLIRLGAARELLSLRDRVSCWNAPLASLHSLANGR